MRIADLELDLDVFAGPFDLLLTLILREEIDLLEVDLAEVVISYIDHLERRGELELEAATEFLVLIAALLELKSRLLLPGEEVEASFSGAGYGAFKQAVADAVVEYLTPVRERYQELRPDEAELERVLAAGAEKARAIASDTLADVREVMGVGPVRARQ